MHRRPTTAKSCTSQREADNQVVTHLPPLYIPYNDPAKWAPLGDHVTATRLQDRTTTAKSWTSQREALHKSLRNLKASQAFAVIQQMNTTSYGNLAAVATRCRFPAVQRQYRQTFRRMLGLLFTMVELVRQRVAKPTLLGAYRYWGPVKEMLASSSAASRSKKKRTPNSKSSKSSTRSKPSQKDIRKAHKTCAAIMKWSMSDN